MLIYEYKLDGTSAQYQAIDEAIRVVQFIRNKCLRKWMDERGVTKNDLQCYCAVLAQEYPLRLVSTPRRGRPVPTVPGLPFPASMTTARITHPVRRAIPTFSMTIGASSTKRRAGSWLMMASTSP